MHKENFGTPANSIAVVKTDNGFAYSEEDSVKTPRFSGVEQGDMFEFFSSHERNIELSVPMPMQSEGEVMKPMLVDIAGDIYIYTLVRTH